MAIQILASIGFLLSAYALYVKWKCGTSKKYKPLCDIGANISCTKAFVSRYGELAGLPNPFFGLIFYAVVFFLAEQKQIIFYLALAAVIASIYLAYISYFKQKNFCVVCTAIYIINILLFLTTIQ